jgi:TPR repeat protein
MLQFYMVVFRLARTGDFMHAFPAILIAGLLAIALSGCSNLPDREQMWSRSSTLFSQSAEVLNTQRKRLANFAGSLVGSKDEEVRDKEIQALFAQPYIDPLTRYIEQHADDDRFAAQLARVAAERGRRCEDIGVNYSERAASRENLNRMRRGYVYSCPSEVQVFSARVDSSHSSEGSTPSSVEDEIVVTPAEDAFGTAEVKGSSASNTELDEALRRRQRSDCYLLFTIRNNTQARGACLPLATRGDAKAQHHMAQLALMRNEENAAADWAKRSAAQKHAPGQMTLAQLYQDGRGVTKDPIRAHRLMKSAADQGLAEAAYHAGMDYQSGDGVSVDRRKAAQYLEQAAGNGHIPSFLALATLYETAQPERARYWLDQAARKGSARAQYLLGESYARGTHGAIDNEEAYVWFSLALLNGYTDASAGIDQQEKMLTANQLGSAQSRVQDGINGRWD